MKSPFKFLDSYTKDDREIFFGREREIEELYHRVFESKTMLVYGISGTGKSSLIHCGLANKFQETDWLPLEIRRSGNILESLAAAIRSVSITPQLQEIVTASQFKKAVKSLYLDHFKPVYFIFDQFEELFILGDKNERNTFIQFIKTLVESELQCRFVFVMREEYVANFAEFEKFIPAIFNNRIRIEKISFSNALEAIKGPCNCANIRLEDGFADALLEKLSPGRADVELTYLQIFLDSIYRAAKDNRSDQSQSLTFSLEILQKTGNVSDLLGNFLDEQIKLLEYPGTGLTILKSFVSDKGTKRQMNLEEIREQAKNLGKLIPSVTIQEMVQIFVGLRILCEKDQNNKFELRHDALAAKIFEKITQVQKDRIEIKQFIEHSFENWKKRQILLSAADLDYIAPQEDNLYLTKEEFDFLKKSKTFVEKEKSSIARARVRKRKLAIIAGIFLILILSGFSLWALIAKQNSETAKQEADKQKILADSSAKSALREKQNSDLARQEAVIQRTIADSNAVIARKERYKADNARQIVLNELYRNIKNSLSVSLDAMNVLYLGIKNPVTIAVSGIPSEKLMVSMKNGTIVKDNNVRDTTIAGQYLATPNSIGLCEISVAAEIRPGKLESVGTKVFRVKSIPQPYPTFAGKTGVDIILKEEALAAREVIANVMMDFDIRFTITGFTVTTSDKGFNFSQRTLTNRLTKDQLSLIQRTVHNQKLFIEDIKAVGQDGKVIDIPPIVLTIYDYEWAINSKNDAIMHKAAIEFFDASSVFRDFKVREIYILHSFEIFKALSNRKPDDMLDQLSIETEYYIQLVNLPDSYVNTEKIKNIELQINTLKDQIIRFNWSPADIDTALNFNNHLSFAKDLSPIVNKLRLPDFVIQLSEKLILVPGIGPIQKEYIYKLCRSLGEAYFYQHNFSKSLSAYQVALKVRPANQDFDIYLPLVYLYNDMYPEAEKIFKEWKDKPWPDGKYKKYGEAILVNFEGLEKEGFTHPDFPKVKELLKK